MKQNTARMLAKTVGLGATVLAKTGFSFAVTVTAQEKPPPNILFIWTDEQNFGMLSCEGNKYIQTPNLDRLAREGVLFLNSFCTYPSCSPSRATVVTGAYAFNHNLCDNVHADRGLEGITPLDGYRLTEEYLQDAGYMVGHRGKWHTGSKRDWGTCFTADPDFSESYCPTWVKNTKPQILQEFPWDRTTKTGKGGYVKGKTDEPTRLTPSWQAVFDRGQLPDWAIVGEMLIPSEMTMEYSIIEDSIQFIEKNKDRLWTLTVSISPPHDPWNVPEPYYSDIAMPLVDKMEIPGNADPDDHRSSISWRVGQRVDDRGIQEYMAIYHAQVVMMDEYIGRVLDTLDRLNLTENTLVIFTSDHGDMLGLHKNLGKINNNLYDRLFHTPCIIRYPAGIKGGKVVNKPVMHVDFKPTMLDYAGISLPDNLDGKSLRPLIEKTDAEWRDYHLLEKFMEVVRNPDHTFVENGFYYAIGIRDENYKYIYTRFNNKAKNDQYCGPRFIDVKNDAFEERNLFKDSKYRTQIKAYHAKLRSVLEENGFPFLDEYAVDPWSER
ncbi:MAG: sulfatase-like hydrolase/transferase [Kiritimatiellales bacterium]